MGVGDLLLWGFLIFCIYSLLNKLIKLWEMNIKHDIQMESTTLKIDKDFRDFKCSDFEDVLEDIKKD